MDELLMTCNYRDFSLPVYKELDTDKCYTIISGKIAYFDWDADNIETELKRFIDRKLDTIETISEDAWLEQFSNSGFNDIKLVYKGRILKIFLVDKETELTKSDVDCLVSESKKIINKMRGLK